MSKRFRSFIFNLILIYVIGGVLSYILLAFIEKLPAESAFYAALSWPLFLFYFLMDKVIS